MNICILITDITTLGGVERTSILLANSLIEAGHNVKVVSLFKKNKSIKFPLGQIKDIIYVKHTGYRLNEDSSNRLESLLSIFSVIFHFRRVIIQMNSNTLFIAQCFLPAALLWLFNKPKQSIVCEHFKYELYNKYICSIRDRIYQYFLQVITLTEEDKLKYLRVISNVRVIPNMTPFAVSTPINVHNKKIISVGRLTHQKGYDYLIDAIAKCKKSINGWSIHIFGDGELYNELTLLAKSKKIDDILHFEGFTSQIEEELSKASIFVLSSRFEGLPMVLLEAMSKGLAIISFDCPEGPRALLENNAGILVENENSNALAEAIEQLTSSIDLRYQYSLNAQIAIKKFSPDIVTEQWITLFKDLRLL